MVTTVTNGAATDSTTGAAAMKKATGMNKDDFLKLFVAQLQHQDPLKPQDGAEFIAQLAQLSQVEQSYNTNSNLQKLMDMQGSSNVLNSVSFIGKNVLAMGDQIPLSGGVPANLNFSLDTAANSVVLSILNSTGTTVRTITTGASSAGQNQAVWDGKDAHGLKVADGIYHLTVQAVDGSGNKTAGTPLTQGVVSGVKLDGVSPVLTINGTDVNLADVLRVKGV